MEIRISMNCLSPELILEIAKHAEVYCVYTLRVCCKAFVLDFGSAFNVKENDRKLVAHEQGIEAYLHNPLMTQRVQAVLYNTYLHMVRHEKDFTFCQFAPHPAFYTSIYQSYQSIGWGSQYNYLKLHAVHIRGEDMCWISLKDSFADGYVSILGWKYKNLMLEERIWKQRHTQLTALNGIGSTFLSECICHQNCLKS